MCSTLVSQDFTGFSVFAHQDLVSYLAFRKGESTPYTFCLVVTSCCTNNHNAIEIGVGSPIQDISSSWSTISDILECVEDAQRREYDEINLWAESLCLLGYDAKPQASGSNTRDMQYDASTVTFRQIQGYPLLDATYEYTIMNMLPIDDKVVYQELGGQCMR